jgi:tRNA-dihydrouridine synthase
VVTKKKKGSGFLPHADLIRRFLDEVCTQTKIDLSLKVRLGLNEPEELIALMPLFNTYPLKKIIIHPRTGKQMYEGSVDLDAFEYAADLSIHEIMYNGDIKDVATFTMLQSRFPKIREWMIGRWAIFNPFLPSLIKGNEQTACPLSIIRNFHDDLYQTYAEVLCGPGHLLDKMKEIWNYLGKSCVGEEKRLSRLARVKNLDQYNETVKALFEQGHWLLS